MDEMACFGIFSPYEGKFRRLKAVKSGFCPFLPVIQASRPIDTCASSSSIDSVAKLTCAAKVEPSSLLRW